MPSEACGRISYVIQGFDGDPATVATTNRQVRCNGCRVWFDTSLFLCPECDHPRPGFNKRLRTAILDNQLHGQTRRQHDEAQAYKRSLKTEFQQRLAVGDVPRKDPAWRYG